MRDDRNNQASHLRDEFHGRAIYITKDMGESWTAHPTSRIALTEPNCMASIVAFDHPTKGRILFFSNPNSFNSRTNITIKTSFVMVTHGRNKTKLIYMVQMVLAILA